jgi:hypothetical protein
MTMVPPPLHRRRARIRASTSSSLLLLSLLATASFTFTTAADARASASSSSATTRATTTAATTATTTTSPRGTRTTVATTRDPTAAVSSRQQPPADDVANAAARDTTATTALERRADEGSEGSYLLEVAGFSGLVPCAPPPAPPGCFVLRTAFPHNSAFTLFTPGAACTLPAAPVVTLNGAPLAVTRYDFDGADATFDVDIRGAILAAEVAAAGAGAGDAWKPPSSLSLEAVAQLLCPKDTYEETTEVGLYKFNLVVDPLI